MNPKADILIVTVTKVESEAVMKVFQEATGKATHPECIGDRMYHDLSEINGVHVFMAISEMGAGGLGASQQAVQKGIDALHPSAVIMVGIAFGVNEQKQAIGDILVSQQLWLYDLQRIGKDEIITRGDKPHASTWLIDRLRGTDFYWKGAKMRFGLVLTGEKLVDNLDYRDQLKRFEPEAIGGEMEGAGLYVACQDSKVDWILVKAICDWADGSKGGPNKDVHQATAAHNAASFVLYAIRLAPLKREAEAQIDNRLDVEERRRAFTLASTASETIDRFRLERVQKIGHNQGIMPIRQTVKAILHLVPNDALSRENELDLAGGQLPELRPLPDAPLGYSDRIGLEVIYCYNEWAYTAIFRNGIVEAVEGLITRKKVVFPTELEIEIVQGAQTYLALLRRLGVELPVRVFFTLIGIAEHSFPMWNVEALLRGVPRVRENILDL
jgi:nucleoside phosphorylase